jgi:hypothetical protein
MRAALIAVRTVLLVPAVAVVLVNFYGPSSSITDPEPVFEEKRVIFIAFPPLALRIALSSSACASAPPDAPCRSALNAKAECLRSDLFSS